MLEKNNDFFCDAHFHYLPSVNQNAFALPQRWTGCSCAHSVEEWNAQVEFAEKNNSENQKMLCAFGLHPQSCSFPDSDELCRKNLYFLESLLQTQKIDAIGECGFDFFTEEYKLFAEFQKKIFISQIELAVKYKKPVVIHCRKANEKLFEYSRELKKLPAVLFHSFMGMPSEAFSLLNKGINGYFSFGKQIFNNNKKVIKCVKELPLDRLLFETDAPYQFLKGENQTNTFEIKKIYEGAWNLRFSENSKLPDFSFCDFSKQIFENLISLFYE